MNHLNRLGLKAVGLTTSVLVVIFGIYWGIRTVFFSPDAPLQLVRQETATHQPLPDADGDGLPDTYENMYQTDPQRGDTDGDGIYDRAEIAAGTDPTIPSPGDEVKPSTGESVQQVAGAKTFTQQYLATLPTDAAREDILDQTRLEAFVATNRAELLPSVSAGTVQTTTDAGATAIQTYLDTIGSSHNKQIHNVTNGMIEEAFKAQLQLNPEPLNTIVTQLEQNVKVLKTIPAPAEVADMHEKLIRATTALHANVMALRDINQDFVGGLIATKNIDELGTIFQEIATSVKELEAKYELQ